MFHIVLGGWIESDNKDFVKELENFINEKNKIVGKFATWEVEELEDDKD